MNEEIDKKSNKIFLSIIIGALIIVGLFSGKYLINKYYKKESPSAVSSTESPEFNNIESEIYQTGSTDKSEVKTEEKPVNQTEVLLKQQLQISELQNNLYTLKAEVERIKTGDALSKIILSFVRLEDLVNQKQNYDNELKKLELLCRADFALSKKIDKLKTILATPSKNNLELIKEFAEISPILKAKKVEIDSHGSWFGKIKAMIARFVIIKKTGEDSKSDFDNSLDQLQKNIEHKEYDSAIQNIENIGPDYQETLLEIKTDLRAANNFKQISNEIYEYLEMLSN